MVILKTGEKCFPCLFNPVLDLTLDSDRSKSFDQLHRKISQQENRNPKPKGLQTLLLLLVDFKSSIS